jgi:hypothetical protein
MCNETNEDVRPCSFGRMVVVGSLLGLGGWSAVIGSILLVLRWSGAVA